jgi:hypothetical protein
MKRMLLGVLLALNPISVGWAQDHAAHPSPNAKAIPAPTNNAELVFDNASVTVIRVWMAPHEKIPMHDLTARVVVWMTDAHLRDIKPTGEIHEENAKAGDVEWVPAQRHEGENLGDNRVELIAIVPKSPAMGMMDHPAGKPHP